MISIGSANPGRASGHHLRASDEDARMISTLGRSDSDLERTALVVPGCRLAEARHLTSVRA
jgi:hypothetical protein